jgi:pantetheine-phosphate adenylyltransferase
MTRVGLYAGSFDPITNGHLAVLTTALGLFDRVVVAIGVHPQKAPMFTAAQRETMIRDAAGHAAAAAGAELDVRTFDTLVIRFAKEIGAHALIRGLRDGSDFDYEMQLAGMNGAMAPAIRTVFLPAGPAERHITATLVRQIAAMGGDVTPFVPANVATALAEKFKTLG